MLGLYLPPTNEVAGRLCLQGGVYTSMPCRFPGPHPRGSLKGLAWGVGGLQAQTQGESPGPDLGGVSQHALRQTSPADSYCCGRYASYWNTFLCIFFLRQFSTTINVHVSIRRVLSILATEFSLKCINFCTKISVFIISQIFHLIFANFTNPIP